MLAKHIIWLDINACPTSIYIYLYIHPHHPQPSMNDFTNSQNQITPSPPNQPIVCQSWHRGTLFTAQSIGREGVILVSRPVLLRFSANGWHQTWNHGLGFASAGRIYGAYQDMRFWNVHVPWLAVTFQGSRLVNLVDRWWCEVIHYYRVTIVRSTLYTIDHAWYDALHGMAWHWQFSLGLI